MRYLVLSAILAVSAGQLQAQQGAFVIRLGRDTLAVERFTRTGNHLEGETVSRQPRTVQRRYSYDFADGRLTRANVALYRPGADTMPYERASATVTRDSMFVEQRRDTSTTTTRVAAPAGFMPVFNPASTGFVAYELAAERVQAARGQDSISIPIVQGAQARTWRAGRMGRDSIWIYDGNNRFLARVDRDGHILGATAVSGTQQFTVERVANADVRALTAAFGARDAQQQGLGVLSTRDTARASVGGATLWIDYGRPAKRGRAIFGTTIVPYGQVWRTGANAATQFRSDRTLEIGGVVVPAGLYTLWTIPSPAGWRLVINSQAGQWGTAHDATKDLFHLPIATSTLPQPVERFTISVVPAGQGGTINLDWDTTRASIPFTVR